MFDDTMACNKTVSRFDVDWGQRVLLKETEERPLASIPFHALLLCSKDTRLKTETFPLSARSLPKYGHSYFESVTFSYYLKSPKVERQRVTPVCLVHFRFLPFPLPILV